MSYLYRHVSTDFVSIPTEIKAPKKGGAAGVSPAMEPGILPGGTRAENGGKFVRNCDVT
jgi:hypothetical protein